MSRVWTLGEESKPPPKRSKAGGVHLNRMLTQFPAPTLQDFGSKEYVRWRQSGKVFKRSFLMRGDEMQLGAVCSFGIQL